MEFFEEALRSAMPALERYLKFHIASRDDAEDLLQECCITAFERQKSLQSPDAFRGWLFAIARNKCLDYYRARAKRLELPMETLRESTLSVGLYGQRISIAVTDVLERLNDRDRQILSYMYIRNYRQDQIASMLNIPLGTVKSRLHAAKQRFRMLYDDPPALKGEMISMKKTFPNTMPTYTIAATDLAPFPVRWEELMGWFLVPKLGESCSWAIYDWPKRKRAEVCTMRVTGRASIHGIEGVEIDIVETDPTDENRTDGKNAVHRTMIAQLTETHCRLLAESHMEDGVRRSYTFLDGDAFLDNWGFGPDNCGNEISLVPKDLIRREGSIITTEQLPFLLDVTDRCTVAINGRTYDTVRVIDCYAYNDGVVSEQFLDHNGRTILWRRFNRDDWAMEYYHTPWSERLPDNERITVNGTVYVHWYDCITDYIL